MKPTRYLSEDELIQRGLSALLRNLGPVETARFIGLRRAGRLESVRRHRQWQTKLNSQQFFEQIFGPERP